ncbi:hypothetical protein U9M48_017595 [Paspalum notatum var. saurae]|uniref:O-acyltransferase WSD1 C-terminal domain-containing protein n=1 Tax=Paspalum notatum var. saurae TaxID=547442 RepID=A0AAQ3T937_PASNO
MGHNIQSGFLVSEAFQLANQNRQLELSSIVRYTTVSFSNMIGPVEQVEFCGHPVVFIAPSGYGPPEALTLNFQSYVNTMMVNLAVDEAQFPDVHDLLEDFVESLKLIRGAASNLVEKHRND